MDTPYLVECIIGAFQYTILAFLEQMKENIKKLCVRTLGAMENIVLFFLAAYLLYFPRAVSIIKDIHHIMKRTFAMKKFWRFALVVVAVSVAIYQGMTTMRYNGQLETVLEATTEEEALKLALKMLTPSEVWLEFFLGAMIAPVGIIMMAMEWNFRLKIHKTIMLGWICSAIGTAVTVLALVVKKKTYNEEVEEI